MRENAKKKVVIGLSGGVDSSVAALILKQQGYDVIGVTMHLCNDSTDAIEDAKKVAEKLDIPFYCLDLRKDFKKYVVDYFAKEYMQGHTPNPCIECNKHLKFGLMLKKAQELFDADYIATGHYAKIEYNEKNSRYYICESDASDKDQTYVLYNLTQEQLMHTLMPLGEYTKEQIREIAKNYGFLNANKKDSQEICFVKDNDYANFIEKEYNYKPIKGEFVGTDANVYGLHKGIIHYTIGQRRGLGLSLKAPLYVKKLDPTTNRVILCPMDELYEDSLICKSVNLITMESLDTPIAATVKIRYSAPKVKATLIPLDNGNIKVVFNEPQKAITPGQAVVFYDNNIVIGGGTII